MTDEELVNQTAPRVAARPLDAAGLLLLARDALDSVAAEVRGEVGSLTEPDWDPGYHLSLTITVGEARGVFDVIHRLDEFIAGRGEGGGG